MKRILFFPVNSDVQFQKVAKTLCEKDSSIESFFLYLVEVQNSNWENFITIDSLVESVGHVTEDYFEIFENKHSLVLNDIASKTRLNTKLNSEKDLKKFYLNYLISLEKYLTDNNIDLVFCSCISDAISYGTYLLCKSMKIPFLYPINARVSEHVYLADSLTSGPVSLIKQGPSIQKVEEIINATFKNQVQPGYANFEYLMIKKGISFSHLKTLFKLVKLRFSTKSKYLYLTDGIVRSVIKFFTRKLSYKELNKVIKFHKIDEIKNMNFIYWPLHLHPEAATIILGRWIYNQYEILKAISRVLPHNVKLFVKEHRGAAGRRDLGFYRNISKLPGVEFVSQDIDTFDMINFSKGVAVISGTAGLEALALNKNVMTFGDIHYNEVSSVVRATDLSNIRNSVNELISQEGHERNEVIRFFSKVLNDTRIVNNFEGTNTSKECVDALTDLLLSYKRNC